MTDKPTYLVHHVDEDDVTVDWFFGKHPFRKKIPQLLLLLVGWFFVVLPLVIEYSAISHRNDEGGWWNYEEGFEMFEVTMITLGILFILFVIGFLVLHLIYVAQAKREVDEKTYDEERLALRLEIADDLYAGKYGAAVFRREQRSITIEPYGDFETYELRDRYRTLGAD